MSDRAEQREALSEAKPFIRSILAFVVYVREPAGFRKSMDECYGLADQFIAQLEKDLNA